MSSEINKKELLNEAYDAVLVMARAVGVSMITKKVAGMPLNTLKTRKGKAKLAAAVALSTMAVK